jgi:hypothetical protein
MLVLENSDEDRLYLAKGLPREWVSSGKETSIKQAPTRWGKVSFDLIAKPNTKTVLGHVELTGLDVPKEVHFKFRLALGNTMKSATVNGEPAVLGGLHHDTVIIITGKERSFEVVGQFS